MVRDQCGRFTASKKFNISIGDIFGKLKVIGIDKNSKVKVLCECECGNKKLFNKYSLINGITKSCGCNQANRTHGHSKTRLYKIWCDMKNRCYNPHVNNYIHYGKRGIKVCNEWKESYEKFEVWALENGYTNSLTIERKDVNGNYEPSNCTWILKQEQASNKRTSVNIEFEGEKDNLTGWAKRIGISSNSLKKRIKKWGVKKALTTPPSKSGGVK